METVAKMTNPPRFYFCCGTDDGVYPNWLHFKDYAEKIGLSAVFDEREGYGHEWRFWELELQETLNFFGFHQGKKQQKAKPQEKLDGTLV